MRSWNHSTLEGPLLAAAGGISGIGSAMLKGSPGPPALPGPNSPAPSSGSDPLLEMLKKHLASAPPPPPAPIQPSNPGYDGAPGGTA